MKYLAELGAWLDKFAAAHWYDILSCLLLTGLLFVVLALIEFVTNPGVDIEALAPKEPKQ